MMFKFAQKDVQKIKLSLVKDDIMNILYMILTCMLFISCLKDTKFEKGLNSQVDTPDESILNRKDPAYERDSDQKPFMAFSDLISGPSSGLNDGIGSGVIVTVWGFNLGEKQKNSMIEYCDSSHTCRTGHVYYWKNADGELPGGPANLFASHGMQEVSFSIPESANGLGQIKITVEGIESTLPFTVRSGSIYYIKPYGDDSNDGSFRSPWLTVAKANSKAEPGSTIYIADVLIGSEKTNIAIFNNQVVNTIDNQYAYIAYPGRRPQLWGHNGFKGYTGGGDVTGFIQSKLSFYISNNDEDSDGQPVNQHNYTTHGIYGSADGRTVGNFVTDTHPLDTNGGCPTGFSAAIVGNNLSGDKVSNWKVLGNHIKDYGCKGTGRQQHTMYFSIRDKTGAFNKPAPEVAYNFLQDNEAAGGVRYYDEDLSGNNKCGEFNTIFKMHDNVVVNQAGEGLGVGAHCDVSTTFEFYNNVVINAGLKSDWNPSTGRESGSHTDAVFLTPSKAQSGNIYFSNNIFYEWNSDGGTNGTQSCIGFDSKNSSLNIFWNENICYSSQDRYFSRSNYQGNSLESRITGENNVWYSPTANPTKAIVPNWAGMNITSDPFFPVIGDSQVSEDINLQTIDKSSKHFVRDLYGRVRSTWH